MCDVDIKRVDNIGIEVYNKTSEIASTLRDTAIKYFDELNSESNEI
jgi:hypothetical protein